MHGVTEYKDIQYYTEFISNGKRVLNITVLLHNQ